MFPVKCTLVCVPKRRASRLMLTEVWWGRGGPSKPSSFELNAHENINMPRNGRTTSVNDPGLKMKLETLNIGTLKEE